MKVGIVTLTGDNNYGQSLQNYAVTTVLYKLGCDPYTIRFENCADSFGTIYCEMKRKRVRGVLIKAFYSMIVLKWRKYQRNNHSRKRRASFDTFNNRISFIEYSARKGFINSNGKEFDYILCGSDQVWNLNFVRRYRDFFFARFADKKKKLAFSASIGTDRIPNDQMAFFKEAINDYKAISVREFKAAELIKTIAERDVVTTVDPTLMLSTEEWRAVEKPVKVDEKYILTYFLGTITDQIKSFIDRIAAERSYKVFVLHGETATCYSDENFSLGPAEFVWLVDHCEMMVTDSYHGCCFSVIFRKPFRWFSRNDHILPNMDNRIDTLFAKLMLGEQCIGDVNESTAHIFDHPYPDPSEKLTVEREVGLQYLKDAFGVQ